MLPQRPQVGVSMDEWGIWVHHQQGLQHGYDLSDGLAAASVLNAFQRLCRRMKMANWAQLVNVLGVINTDETRAWETPIATVFGLYSNLCREVAVACEVESDRFTVGSVRPDIPDLPYLDASATRSPKGDHTALCVVNRHRDAEVACRLSITPSPAGECIAREMNGDHWFADNGPQEQRVTVKEKTLGGWPQEYRFPAHSLTLFSC